MPAGKKGPFDPPEMSPDGLLLLIGQLLEATKAATEGIKGLSVEVRSNATAIITAAKTLEILEGTVSQLDNVVRSGPDNLVQRIGGAAHTMEELQRSAQATMQSLNTLRDQVDGLGQHRLHLTSTANTILYIAMGVSWLIGTGISIYALLR